MRSLQSNKLHQNISALIENAGKIIVIAGQQSTVLTFVEICRKTGKNQRLKDCTSVVLQTFLLTFKLRQWKNFINTV